MLEVWQLAIEPPEPFIFEYGSLLQDEDKQSKNFRQLRSRASESDFAKDFCGAPRKVDGHEWGSEKGYAPFCVTSARQLEL